MYRGRITCIVAVSVRPASVLEDVSNSAWSSTFWVGDRVGLIVGS